MTNTARALSTALVVATLASGCGPSWIIVKQSNPNTLVGKKSFAVEPVAWQGLSIGGKDTEEAWIAKRKPEEQAQFKTEWETDKAESAKKLAARLGDKMAKIAATVAGAPGGDAVTIRGKVELYEPGFWSPMGFGNADTVVVMNVDFTDAAGAPQDTVKFTARVPGSIIMPAPGQRLREGCEQIADQVISYLAARTAVPK